MPAALPARTPRKSAQRLTRARATGRDWLGMLTQHAGPSRQSGGLTYARGMLQSLPQKHRVVCAVLDVTKGESCDQTRGGELRLLSEAMDMALGTQGMVLVIIGEGSLERVGDHLESDHVTEARDRLSDSRTPLLVILGAEHVAEDLDHQTLPLATSADIVLAEAPQGLSEDALDNIYETGLVDQLVAKKRLAGVVSCLLDTMVGEFEIQAG